MPSGGFRLGAGRKKGSPTKKRPADRAPAVKKGVTPAEVMQKAMEWHLKAGRYEQAAAIARDLAPYRHPKKAAVADGAQAGPVLALVQITYVELLKRTPDELARLQREALGIPLADPDAATGGGGADPLPDQPRALADDVG